MFLIKISPKINFGDRNCNFQNLRGHENIKKSCVNNNASIFQPKNPKAYWPFSYFCEPVRTIWHDPSVELDLSCSEHFFWLHCDHFSVPNDLICFESFGSPPIPARNLSFHLQKRMHHEHSSSRLSRLYSHAF